MLSTLYAKIKAKERAWKRGFGMDISTPAGRRAARKHNNLVDHAFLRRILPNRYQLSPDAWRSNQPDPVHFPKLAEIGIKSVINLRGPDVYSYYLFEKEACAEYDMALYDLPLQARELLPAETYLELFRLMDEVEKPMLLHCKSGADRTGLAAAFYMIDYMGAPVEEAAKQLSIKYAHQHWSKAGILDHLIAAYARYIETEPMPIRDWIRDHYDPEVLTASFNEKRGKTHPTKQGARNE